MKDQSEELKRFGNVKNEICDSTSLKSQKLLVQKLISIMIRQRVVVLLLAAGLFVWGIYSIKPKPN